MKLLIVLVAVLAGVWLWQRGRRLKHSQDEESPRTGQRSTLPMVRCTRCGVHVPGNEAVVGHAGQYCSLKHRRESEGE